jgi:hypothetical protein
VKNPDGSESNVLLGTFGIGQKQYVLPTMVEGKKLTPDQAVNIARQHGLNKYPNFLTPAQADSWARKNHSFIGEDGKLKK